MGVRVLGGLLIAIVVGVLALVLLVKLVFFTVKAVAVLIAIGIAALVYVGAEKLIGQGR